MLTIFMPEPITTVFVFCALMCEAKPLIKAWQLKKLSQPGMPFSIYTDGQRAVVISGIGKTAMAGAVGYTMALFDVDTAPILLNLGIAGHGGEPLGRFCVGHKITDSETGKVYYPQLPFSMTCPTYSITTQAKPCIDYSTETLFDMEASGFYELAVKLSSSELIQVLKIVSDNSQTSMAAIDELVVEQWITQKLDMFEDLLNRLSLLRQQLRPAETALHAQLLGEFRFTVSGAIKLKALLQRWQVLKGNEAMIWQNHQLNSGKDFLAWLEKQLDEAAFYL